MTQKILYSLCLFLAVSLTLTTQAKVTSDGVYLIPKTWISPVIDGIQDDVWKTLDWNFQRIYTVDGVHADSGSGLTGMHKMMWDDNNLYILFFNQDDDIQDNPAQTAGWQKDAVEIYIDGDNSKILDNVYPDLGAGLAPGDVQITIPHAFIGHEPENTQNLDLPTGVPTEGIEFKITEEDNISGLGGWWLEMKIPLDNLNIIGTVGTKIGLELQQDESDGSAGQRESISKWWNGTNNSWTDASIWGTAELTDRLVSDMIELKKIPVGISIKIDGILDPIYKQGNPITENYFRVNGSGDISNIMFDAFLTTYLMWDDSFVYAFFDITDDEIQDNPAQTTGWQKDAIELYIDGDNSKIPDSTGFDPGAGLAPGDAHMTIPHALKGFENAASIGLPSDIPLEGIEFKIKDKEGGWNLEMKLPVDNFNIIGAEGTRIGIEVQLDESDTDDNGQRGSIEKWWNSSNNSWTDASLWGTVVLYNLSGDDPVCYGPCGCWEPCVEVNEIEPNTKIFSLNQNFPNPFNPTTNISFSIPEAGLVSIKIYNVLGQEVAELLNKELKAGTFETEFDGSDLPGGIYFYKLQSGKYSLTKKMILLK